MKWKFPPSSIDSVKSKTANNRDDSTVKNLPCVKMAQCERQWQLLPEITISKLSHQHLLRAETQIPSNCFNYELRPKEFPRNNPTFTSSREKFPKLTLLKNLHPDKKSFMHNILELHFCLHNISKKKLNNIAVQQTAWTTFHKLDEQHSSAANKTTTSSQHCMISEQRTYDCV